MPGTEMVALGKWLTEKLFVEIFGEAHSRLMRRRAEEARDILQGELAKGRVSAIQASDLDEFAAMIFAFTEAARQGAARRNLKMLAQIMAEKLNSPPIYANEFLRLSKMLADLSHGELIALARLHEHYADQKWKTPDGNREYSGLEKSVKEVMIAQGAASNWLDAAGTLGALQRTGLLVHSTIGFGAAAYMPTPKLDELIKLIDIGEIIAEPDKR